MTKTELESFIDTMSDVDAANLRHTYRSYTGLDPGERSLRNDVIREFVQRPDFERHLCLLFGVPTEAERALEYSRRSASASESSADSARGAKTWAIVAGVAGVVGILVSIVVAVINWWLGR